MAVAADGIGNDTIHALSSGALPSAIAIVRISGPDTDDVLTSMIGRLPPARRAVLREVRDADGEPIDRALVLRFPGPDSATGKDVAELHLHGGRAIVAATTRTLTSLGSRQALPGEFTRRALLSGRIDFAMAEGLADLIEAETAVQHRDALRRSEGSLGRLAREWHDRVTRLAALVEYAIDYDEDDVVDIRELHAAIHGARHDLDDVLGGPSVSAIRDGIRVVLAGPPNAGKSALFNRILGSDAAIVSEHPGTTRDLNARPFATGGIAFVLIDTAGVRDAVDDVEREGITRARGAIVDADIILDLGDVASGDARTIAVSAKSDIVPTRPDRLATSAVTGEGIADLLAAITVAGRAIVGGSSAIALDDRHRAALSDVAHELSAAGDATEVTLVAEHLRAALASLDGLTGFGATERLLDTLFSRFCLGK